MQSPQTKICLIGGTFDPIHLGHTYIALAAKKALDLDKVIFLPCKQSPHKLDIETASDNHRLRMCELATENLSWAEVSDYDLTAPPPSYSWRTAEHFSKLYPDAELFWLMGTDQWNSLPRWARAEYFSELVKIIVYHRGNVPQPISGFSNININGSHPASATAVRSDLTTSKAVRWIHPKVAEYIKENKLYAK
jgi:nicotinate-nucleotide adenylyltransferase